MGKVFAYPDTKTGLIQIDVKHYEEMIDEHIEKEQPHLVVDGSEKVINSVS